MTGIRSKQQIKLICNVCSEVTGFKRFASFDYDIVGVSMVLLDLFYLIKIVVFRFLILTLPLS